MIPHNPTDKTQKNFATKIKNPNTGTASETVASEIPSAAVGNTNAKNPSENGIEVPRFKYFEKNKISVIPNQKNPNPKINGVYKTRKFLIAPEKCASDSIDPVAAASEKNAISDTPTGASGMKKLGATEAGGSG